MAHFSKKITDKAVPFYHFVCQICSSIKRCFFLGRISIRRRQRRQTSHRRRQNSVGAVDQADARSSRLQR